MLIYAFQDLGLLTLLPYKIFSSQSILSTPLSHLHMLFIKHHLQYTADTELQLPMKYHIMSFIVCAAANMTRRCFERSKHLGTVAKAFQSISAPYTFPPLRKYNYCQ